MPGVASSMLQGHGKFHGAIQNEKRAVIRAHAMLKQAMVVHTVVSWILQHRCMSQSDVECVEQESDITVTALTCACPALQYRSVHR